MNIKIRLLTEMLGTVTKDPEIYKKYIETKKPEEKNDEDESLTIEKLEEKGWTGFHKDENGLFIYEYMVKGFFSAVQQSTKGENTCVGNFLNRCLSLMMLCVRSSI